MIGKGVGARQGFPAGAMGEAFGDFDALEFVNEATSHRSRARIATPRARTSRATATTASATSSRAGRWAAISRQPGQNPDTDPLNHSDIGFDNVGPEVHADGEIWIATQFDLRDLFLQRYPSSGAAEDIACLRGQQTSVTCPGDRRWIQLYYDAMVMMPRNPTLQDARDAELAADMARFGGANQDLLWQGYALRGLGQYPTSDERQRADTDPTPDFSSPLANNATLTFFAVGKDGTRRPGQREDLRRRLPGPLSGSQTRTRPRNPGTDAEDGQPRRHGAVRPDRPG